MVSVGIGILMAVVSLASIVFFVMVLIKQFSKGGVLQGLLGLITCGLWTYIWGWIRHRNFNMTRIMIMWSACYIISAVLSVVAGGTVAMEVANLMGQAKGDLKAQVNKQNSHVTDVRKRINRPQVSTGQRAAKPAAKTQPGAGGGIDSDQLADAAMSLWQNGRYADPEGAVEAWSEILKTRPDSAEAYNNRGVAHYDAKRYPEAISDYGQAIRLKADYAVAFNNRGNARYEMGQYQEAIADFSASLRLDPGYAAAHSNRGLAHYRLQELAQACQDFQNACESGDCSTLKWAMSNGVCK